MSVIQLQNMSLDYIVRTGTGSIKKASIHSFKSLFSKTTSENIYNSSYRALNNISLTLNKGDRVGILGRNGAGKSTLLRVMAKVYKPQNGIINVTGKISTLFDVSLGLNSEASGYENIIMLAVMRGFTTEQAQQIIPDVEEFSELGEFLNKPVRTYSTGMQMKLAFAVATAHCPEILLVDEIIGAGDFHFMQKATERINKLIEQSHILVLTSHDNKTIKRFCNKVIVLEKGELKYFGEVQAGIEFYSSLG